MKTLALAASAAMLLVATNADAAVLTYRVAGTFVDGSVLSGQFSFDNTGVEYSSQFSNVSVNVSGPAPVSAVSVNGSTSFGGDNQDAPIRYGFYPVLGATGNVELGLQADYTSQAALRAIRSPVLLNSGDYATFYRNAAGARIALTAGTVTLVPAVVAGVPEPGAWGLMLIGFGLVGAGLRARRRSTTFIYA